VLVDEGCFCEVGAEDEAATGDLEGEAEEAGGGEGGEGVMVGKCVLLPFCDTPRKLWTFCVYMGTWAVYHRITASCANRGDGCSDKGCTGYRRRVGCSDEHRASKRDRLFLRQEAGIC